jgi:hypothetical protein
MPRLEIMLFDPSLEIMGGVGFPTTTGSCSHFCFCFFSDLGIFLPFLFPYFD